MVYPMAGFRKKPEDDDDDSETEESSKFTWASKEGIIFSSIILVFVLVIQHRIWADFWNDTSDNSNLYFKIVIVVVSILLVLGILVAVTEFGAIIRTDLIGSVMVFAGAFVTILGPAGKFFGMTPHTLGDSLQFTIPGIALIVAGGVWLARSGGYFGAWFVGLGAYLGISMMEAFALGSESGVGEYTQGATAMALGIIIMSLVLFFYSELKFFFIIPMVRKGNELRREKKYDDALKVTNKVLMLYPNFSTAWNNKGNLMVNLKKFDEAVECYNRAIKLNPGYAIARKNLQVVQRKSASAA